MPRKDKNITPSVTQKLQQLGYSVADWDDSKTKLTEEIKEVLSKASKSQKGNEGYPDRVYIDEKNKLLILVEEKPTMKEHLIDDIEKGAVAGIKWYLSKFQKEALAKEHKNLVSKFSKWNVLGIAASGDFSKEYQYKFSCFVIDKKTNDIKLLPQITNFVKHEDFLAIFNSLNEEEAINQISQSSKKINNLLRNIDSQKRPVLLSALMICLHKTNENGNDFPDIYQNMNPETLSNNVLPKAKSILENEGIPKEKLEVLETELAYLKTDVSLKTTDVLMQILDELQKSVIPLFNDGFSDNSNYDIIGKFYEEFLKYAGVSNVKKGIVLTPRHITTLFTKLVDIKDNDKILDLCCGTGAFLIAGMNEIIKKINESNRSDKIDAIRRVKENQLLGFELNPTMYICAISNMLFRGDGKSSIYNCDSIYDKKAQDEMNKFGATIGFINPPYSGKENKENPTPKEITFLSKLLDNCSRYGVIIAPFSTYFKDDDIRENILKKHTLKCVINMPADLFQPNASTHTAIAVFETHRPFDYKKDKVVFYDLKDDGFVLSKNKGRTDVYDKWNEIEKDLIKTINGKGKKEDNITYIKTLIKPGDEWNIYAHSEINFNNLYVSDFVVNLSNYLIFSIKKDMDILNKNFNELQIMELMYKYFTDDQKKLFINYILKKNNIKQIDTGKWKEFCLNELFEIYGSKTTKVEDLETKYGYGEFPYITTKATDNGVAGFYNCKTEKANVLTIDSAVLGYVTYQDIEFSASDHVEILEPKSTTKINKWIAIFIKTMIEKGNYKYDYGRKFNQERIKTTCIKLPIDKSGKPDWDYMEKFIKKLPYGDLI